MLQIPWKSFKSILRSRKNTQNIKFIYKKEFTFSVWKHFFNFLRQYGNIKFSIIGDILFFLNMSFSVNNDFCVFCYWLFFFIQKYIKNSIKKHKWFIYLNIFLRQKWVDFLELSMIVLGDGLFSLIMNISECDFGSLLHKLAFLELNAWPNKNFDFVVRMKSQNSGPEGQTKKITFISAEWLLKPRFTSLLFRISRFSFQKYWLPLKTIDLVPSRAKTQCLRLPKVQSQQTNVWWGSQSPIALFSGHKKQSVLLPNNSIDLLWQLTWSIVNLNFEEEEEDFQWRSGLNSKR